MKKVAIVYHYFAHYRAPVFRALADSEKTDYYFLGDPAPTDDIKRINFENEEKLKYKFIPLKNTWLGMGFLWQRNLLRALTENDFEAVIFLGDIKFITTWFALIITRLRGKKAYLWGHGLYGKESWLNLQVKLLFLKLSNGIFLYNNRAKGIYLKNGAPPHKLTVIYNSLNFDETEYYRELYKTENKSKLLSPFSNHDLPVAMYIGRVNQGKKIDMLIHAIRILKKQNIDLNCLIIGDGNDKANLEKLAKEMNMEGQVHLTGAKYSEKDISQYMMASDVCVCPGPIGLTGIHSLSYGVPAISNDNFNMQGPEHEAIIPGVTGYFYKEGDVEDLADKIHKCIILRLSNKEKNIQDCLAVIHNYYNPYYQRKTIDAVLSDQI